jgi:hypothetical protein
MCGMNGKFCNEIEIILCCIWLAWEYLFMATCKVTQRNSSVNLKLIYFENVVVLKLIASGDLG